MIPIRASFLSAVLVTALASTACTAESVEEDAQSSADALSCDQQGLDTCRKYGGGAACTAKWCSSSSSSGGTQGAAVSTKGRAQMEALVGYASSHHSGASRGRCFEYVWRYLTTSGYGALDDYTDAPDMPSAYARNFAEYMNTGGNAARWGLQRLAITNPYDAPRGAVVVVAAGSPGTAHPTAGDISIAAGGGRFINDGPNMSYGGSRAAFASRGGRVLGIYVPR
ncbi:MAG: hypothetical protein JST00_32315 [Deltaproteobacteria bacterium]|nr:hypothetical protein [Deltaproteobacteria bacterium]